MEVHISKEELEEKLDEDFKQVIIDFSKEKLPRIYELSNKYKDEIDINIFKSRDEADNYIKKMNKRMNKDELIQLIEN